MISTQVERKLPTHYDRASGEFKFEDGDGLEVDCVILCENQILRRVRVDLHAIDATPARWRGDAGSLSLDRARDGRVIAEYPTHWLISTQAVAVLELELA